MEIDVIQTFIEPMRIASIEERSPYAPPAFKKHDCFIWFYNKTNSFYFTDMVFDSHVFNIIYDTGFIKADGAYRYDGAKMQRFSHVDYKEPKRKPISAKVRGYLLSLYNYTCAYCDSGKLLQIDHIYPFSKGGTNDIDNLQVLCRKCNLTKRDSVL